MASFDTKSLKNVLSNLDKAEDGLRLGLKVGLKRGALFLQSESMKQVPVDLCALRASAFTRDEGGLNGGVYVGYTAKYAAYVHEMPMKHKGEPRTGTHVEGQRKKGYYWDPQGRGKNKFLEDPVKDKANREKINQIVKTAMGIKF